MAKGRRTTQGRYGRRKPNRAPRERILIVSEGSVTEPMYFTALVRYAQNPLVKTKVIGKAKDPLKLVEFAATELARTEQRARKEGDSFLAFDQAWCVFDRDDHSTIEPAFTLARREGIHLAVSTPCFELWGLLHFCEQRTATTRQELRRKLSRFVEAYEKELPFDQMKDHVEIAEQRAQALDRRSDTAHANPSTGVYRLTRVIRCAP